MSTGKIIVNVSIVKVSNQTRTSAAEAVGQMAPTGDVFKNHPDFKGICDSVVLSGIALDGSCKNVASIKKMLEDAKTDQEQKRVEFDKSYAIFAAFLERYAKKESDVTGAGGKVGTRTYHGLELPTNLEARYDPKKKVIRAHVILPEGMRACRLEIASAAEGPYKEVVGVAARRTLSGYAAGTYWLKAATLKGEEQSEFFGPVSVIVS